MLASDTTGRNRMAAISRNLIAGLALVFLGGAGSLSAAVVQATTGGGIVYFLNDASSKLERYELTQRQWLAPLTLPSSRGIPTVISVDPGSLYVAYGTSVYRYALDGSGETHLINAQYPVQAIHVDGSVIFINFSSGLYARFASINKNTNTLIATFDSYINSVFGSSIAPAANKVFGRTQGIGPSDISFVRYSDSGAFLENGASPYHGDYPDATKTWIFPNQAKVVDSAGIVYSTGDLSYVGSLAGAIDDLAFSGADVPVVVRGKELIAHTSSLLPTGSKVLARAPFRIYVDGTDVLAFSLDAADVHGVSLTVVPLSELKAPTPGVAVNPVNLPFTPDSSFLGNDGLLYLFSKANQSIFRWDPASQKYADTIPLIGVPNFAAYSPAINRIYVAYPSGLIRKIDLGDPTLEEKPFYNLPSAPKGLSTAGEYLFAMDDSGAWGTHYTIARTGILIDSEDWNYYSTEFIWNNVTQKMYFFRDDTSPNDLLWEEINANGSAYPTLSAGGIGVTLDSPLHQSEGFLHPIRISPDGGTVVLGSGKIHDAVTLARSAQSLANSVTDIAWMANTDLRTIRNIGNVTQYQRWLGATYAQDLVKQYPGVAHRLIDINSSKLLGISIPQDGRPSFYVLDSGFEVVAPSNLEAPSALAPGTLASALVPLKWADVSGETAYVVERKTLPDGGWGTVATTGVSETAFTDNTVANGFAYAYRVTAKNGALVSAPSSEISVSLKAPLPPTNLTSQGFSPTIVTLAWADVADNSGYKIERALLAEGPWTQITTAGADTTNATLMGLQPGTTYYFRIKANNLFGDSAYSGTTSLTTSLQAPAAPSLNIPVVVVGKVTLSWSDVAFEDSYTIFRRLNGSPTWTTLATLPANTTSYADTSVVASTSYDYRAQAANSVGGSGYSVTRTVTAAAAPPLPMTPPFIISSANSSSSIAIFWAASTGATGYKVERTFDGQNWALLATTGAGETYFTDTGLRANTFHQYRVRATNASGDSMPSSTALSSTLSKLAEWRLTYFGTTSASGQAASLATGTDGVPNLMKFASNLSPSESGKVDEASGTKGTATITINPDNNRLRVNFVRLRASANPGILYEVQFSSSFGDWQAGGAEVEVTPIDNTWERVTWEDSVSIHDVPRRFGRLKVSEQVD